MAGVPIRPEIQALVDQGKQCGHCLVNICPEFDPDSNLLTMSIDNMTGTGQRTLCPACDAAGKEMMPWFTRDDPALIEE